MEVSPYTCISTALYAPPVLPGNGVELVLGHRREKRSLLIYPRAKKEKISLPPTADSHSHITPHVISEGRAGFVIGFVTRRDFLPPST